MSILIPPIARGPYLDLEIPSATEGAVVTVRNVATDLTMSLDLPANFVAATITFDWTQRTIVDGAGADRSALLSPTDNGLWTAPLPFVPGATEEIQIEASDILAAKDEWAQAAGALNGKTSEKGGNWATSGSSPDFAVTSKAMARSTTSDGSGRVALLSEFSLGNLTAELDITWGTGKVSTISFIDLVGPGVLIGLKSDASGNVGLTTEYGGVFENTVTFALTLGRKYRLVADRRSAAVAVSLLDTTTQSVVAATTREKLSTVPVTGLGVADEHTVAAACTRTYERFRVFGGAFNVKARLRWIVGYY